MSVSSHTDTHSTSVPSASSASAHATGVADSGRWSTRRIAVYALFVALSIAAVLVSVLGFVPHVFADPWGSLMAIAVALAMSVPAALIYRRARTRRGALIGIIAGAVVALVVAIIGNLLVTPIYADMTVEQVAAMIVPALLPFNLAKLTVHGVVTFLIYKPISNLLNR